MSVKVAINGFGRIGVLVFRQLFESEGYDIVAVNAHSDPDKLAYLLKYDTTQGGFCGRIGENRHTVETGENCLIVDGKKIAVYKEDAAINLPWKELGVDVVMECTGHYNSKEKAQAHIDAGAKKVVISAPAGDDLPTVVYNVNHKILKPEDTIISAASCTTNCLAPMAAALHAFAPIQTGIMSTIHAYTSDQRILDGSHKKDVRRGRAGASSIVPNSTGAAKAIGLVIPELKGKLIGSAQRVPVPTGSTTILVAVVKGRDITQDKINAAMKAASNETLGYTEDKIVSSDVIGMKYGALFDATQTMVAKIDDDTYQVQVVSWYDNEMSYATQMVRTIKYFAAL
jgi:glyceraldehyde 3-phosphate dehydrogenase